MTKIFAIAAAALSLAGAAVAQESLRIGDLDLTTERGVAQLNNRIAHAASRDCASEHATGSRTTGGVAACEREFRRAALAALPQTARDQMAAARRSDVMVSAR